MPPRTQAAAAAAAAGGGELLCSANDALAAYVMQLNFLSVVQVLVLSSVVGMLQSETRECSGGDYNVCHVRVALLSATLVLEMSALVCVVCVGLRAVTMHGVRMHTAASPAQLLLLTSRLTRRENSMVGRSAMATIIGLVCFAEFGIVTLLRGGSSSQECWTDPAMGWVVVLSGALLCSVFASLRFCGDYTDDDDDEDVDRVRVDNDDSGICDNAARKAKKFRDKSLRLITLARHRAAGTYRDSAETMLRGRYREYIVQ